MRRTRCAAAVAVLALTAACGQPSRAGDVAVAAGGGVDWVPAPTSTTTTTTAAPATTTTAAPATTTTRRPAVAPTTATTAPRPTTTTTTTLPPATVTVRAVPREDGTGFRVTAEVTTTDAVRLLRIDFGDGTRYDLPPWRGWTCAGHPRAVSASDDHTFPVPGTYTIRAVATVTRCTAVRPDGTPVVPPLEERVVEAHVVVTSR